MSWGNLVFGIIVIIVGIWIRFFPNTISGINMMTQKEKDKLDLEKFSKSLCKLLIIFGITVSAGYYLLYWIGLYYIANNMILWGFPILIIMAGVFYFRSQLPDKK